MPIQFPSSRGGNNSWMSFLLLTSRPVFQLTLSVAKWHKRDGHTGVESQTDCSDLLAATRKIIQKLPLATSSLPSHSRERQAEAVVTVCACLVQAINLGVSLQQRRSFPGHSRLTNLDAVYRLSFSGRLPTSSSTLRTTSCGFGCL